MLRSRLLLWCAAVALAPTAIQRCAFAEGGEVGFSGGGSIYLKKSISGSSTQAKVGFGTGFSGGAWVEHTTNEHFGGEIRYLYEQNKLEVASGGTKATFAGRSHAVHYDVLFYPGPADTSVRPFIAVGGGIKGYQGTGEESAVQPLQNIALLTKTNQWKGLVVFGGGLKFALRSKVNLRVAVYDYLSQFPSEVIVPVPGVQFGGWIHNIVPSVGISFGF